MASLTSDRFELDLDRPLIKFHPTDVRDWWRIRDAFDGVQIFGGIGSGKSSGSGRSIAKSFLENGFGGLVLCAKKDEKDAWVKYAQESGRSEDLLIFGKNSAFEFNPLDYELNRDGEGAGEVFNLSYLFMEIYKMGNRFSGGGQSKESERYWDNALKRCLNRMIDLLKTSKEELSVENMRSLITSAPTEEEVSSIGEKTNDEWLQWSENSYCVNCLILAGEFASEGDDESKFSYDLLYEYFFREFACLEDKARSTIKESFLGLAEPFLSGILRKYFSNSTNIFPEQTFEGKIIILDFPVKEFLQAGVYAQGIFKLFWQQAVERRDISKYPNPTFLWIDESQYFVNEYDTKFQTTARSSRACSVFLTQNISNYYSQMGGDMTGKAKVDSLLGNLSTKIFHSNNDAVTNEWASKTIGQNFISMKSSGKQMKNFALIADTKSVNYATQLLPQVLPLEFSILKSGGPMYEYQVQAILQIKGRSWSDDNNFKMVTFSQT